MLPNPLSCVHEAYERLTGRSTVQTLIFERPKFTQTSARAWARRNGFKSGYVDVKPSSLRIRQEAPTGFSRMRTITLARGVQAVVGWR